VFDEVHRNGVPWTRRDGELFEEAVRLVTRDFGTAAGNTRLGEGLNVGTKLGPGVFTADKLKSLRLTKMTSCGVVMLVLEDAKADIATGGGVVGYIGAIVEEEESRVRERPVSVVKARFEVLDVLLSHDVVLEAF
jgi:hypothetical protein